MTPEILAARYKTDRAYRRWFERWWKEDFSVGGRKASLRFNDHVEKFEYAGRLWPIGWVPPHDLQGLPNTSGHFRILSLPNVEFYWPNIKDDLSGSYLDRVGVELSRTCQYKFSNAFVVGDVLFESSSDLISIRSAFVCGNLSLSASTTLTLNASDAHISGSATIHSARNITYDLERSYIGEKLSITGEYCEGNIHKLKCGGDFHLSGSADGSGVIVMGSAHINAPPSNRSKHVIKLPLIRTRGDLSVYGTAKIVDLNKFSSKNARIEINDCDSLLLNKGKSNDLSVSGLIVTIDADGLRCTGQILISEIKAKFINMSAANVIGPTTCKNVDVEKFNICDGFFGGMTFTNSKFLEIINASRSVFNHQASFSHCAFPGRVCFSNARFLEGAVFKVGSGAAVNSDASFKQIGEADFTGCEFHPNSSEVCADFDGRQTLEAASFELCRFVGVPMFFGCVFHENVSFRGAKFEIVAPKQSYWDVLSSLSFSSFPASVGELRLAGRSFGRALGEAGRRLVSPFRERRTRENQRLARYERAYTALRQRFSEISNAKFERMFHIYELRARRKRRDSEASFLEGIVSWTYDRVSVYGQSISRPLMILVGLWLCFGIIYFIIAASYSGSSLLESLVFSTRQIVKPFSAWSRDFTLPATISVDNINQVSPWLSLLLKTGTDYELVSTTVVRILASLQSFFGLVLIFLSGLAARRTFGVN